MIILYGVSLGETDAYWWSLIRNMFKENDLYIVQHLYKDNYTEVPPTRKQLYGRIKRENRLRQPPIIIQVLHCFAMRVHGNAPLRIPECLSVSMLEWLAQSIYSSNQTIKQSNNQQTWIYGHYTAIRVKYSVTIIINVPSWGQYLEVTLNLMKKLGFSENEVVWPVGTNERLFFITNSNLFKL